MSHKGQRNIQLVDSRNMQGRFQFLLFTKKNGQNCTIYPDKDALFLDNILRQVLIVPSKPFILLF